MEERLAMHHDVEKKCLDAIFSWKNPPRNTPAHTWPHTRCDMCAGWWWAVCCWGSTETSRLLVWETETWLQSECMVRTPRSPVATVLKYESARPFFFPSLFFLCPLQTLISVPPLDPCTKAQQPLPRSFTRSVLFSFKLPEHLFFPPQPWTFFPLNTHCINSRCYSTL